MNEELRDIIEEMELIEAYNERGKDSDKWLELDERREELEAELNEIEGLGAQYYGVTVFKGCQVVDDFTMWGESPEDLREWLGTIYEEIADSTPEAIDEYTIDRRWYGIEYEENGELYTVVIDELK